MLKTCLFYCLVLPVQLFCQNNGNNNFKERKKGIDLICKTIDSDTTLAKLHIEFSGGDSVGFIAEGYGYYTKTKDELIKFLYKGYGDSITIKSFYYFEKKLVKVLDDKEAYYYTDTLRDKIGIELLPVLTERLHGVEELINSMPASATKQFLNHL